MANKPNVLEKLMNGYRVITLRKWIQAHFVRKDGNKGLSTNDYTDAEKQRVANAATIAEVEEIIARLPHGIVPKGSVDTMADLLAIENPEYGDMWDVRETGMNYVWVNGKAPDVDHWDDMGGLVDLSDYVRKEDIDFLTEEEMAELLGDCISPEAFERMVAEGGEITLETDLALDKKFVVSKDTVIDLNGYDITADLETELFTVNGKKLTLKGSGSIQNAKWIAQIVNGGEVIIESGSYITNYEGFKAVGAGSKITMNGGYVKTRECSLYAKQGAAIEFNDGLIETVDNMGLGTNGSSGNGGNTIVMNGGKIDANIESAGYEAIGIYIANNDTFVMNGGEVVANGGTALCMRAGDVTINDGILTATGVNKSGEPVSDGKIADCPTVMTGVSSVIYHEKANYPGKEGMCLTINGGKITGVDHSVEVLSNEETPNVHVEGGTFVPPYPET